MSIRQEVHAFVDAIDEQKLVALKPLLIELFSDSVFVETDLTDEERAIIDAGMEAHRRGDTIRMENINWDAS
jgi:hypothetical protein